MRSRVTRVALYASPFVLAALAALAYFSLAPRNSAAQTGSVQVAGSETMRAVVTACAEDFMARNPKADVIVKGGGSGDGIAAMLHGIVDIGMMSRDLTQRERDFAQSKGIVLSISDFGLDGITIVVDRSNAIADLTLDQLQGIFAGKIRNWRELGGTDAEILPFARAAGSGTASMFDDRVLHGGPYGPGIQRLSTNEAIVSDVAKQAGAIGYASLGALRTGGERIRIVPLRIAPDEQAVAPTADAVRAGRYPLIRVLHLATPGRPTGATKAFLDFCTGAAAQPLLQNAGYVSLAPAQ